MNFLMFALLGLVVGAIAKLFMPGRDPGGFIITALLGMGGSLLAAFIGRQTGYINAGADGPSFLASILGAMVLLLVYRFTMGKGGALKK